MHEYSPMLHFLRDNAIIYFFFQFMPLAWLASKRLAKKRMRLSFAFKKWLEVLRHAQPQFQGSNEQLNASLPMTTPPTGPDLSTFSEEVTGIVTRIAHSILCVPLRTFSTPIRTLLAATFATFPALSHIRQNHIAITAGRNTRLRSCF